MKKRRSNTRALRLGPVAAGLTACLSGCGGPKPASTSDEAKSDPPPVVAASRADAAPVPEGPKDADASEPAGSTKLTADETNALEGQCKPFVEAVAKAAKKVKLPKGAWESEQMLAALEKPPKVKDVDEAKCAEIVRKDQTSKRAKMAENDARMVLDSMHEVLGANFKETKKLCPAADPAPAAIDGTKALGGLETTRSDWAKGWACLKLELWNQPARWQYELKSNPGGGTFELVARGFPVVGGPEAELFLPGIVDAVGVAPKGAVKRR